MAFMINTKNRSVATSKVKAYVPPKPSQRMSLVSNTQSSFDSIIHGSSPTQSRLQEVQPFETGDPIPGRMYAAVMPRAGMKYVYNTMGSRVEIPSWQPTRYVGNGPTAGSKKDSANFKQKVIEVNKRRTLMF